jgi:hypothetical protein
MVSNRPTALYHPLLYGRRTAPSKNDSRTLEGMTHNYSAPARDDSVTSGRQERSSPSLSTLCGHPCHCNATSTPLRPLRHHVRRCGSMRRRDTATLATVPCTALCRWHPRTLTQTDLERAASAPLPSKPLLEAHRTRHDAPPEAGFARTTIYSMVLCTMPLHVGKIVWHACKLLPPWPIKGGAVP